MQKTDEPSYVVVAVEQIPVEPGGVVVLAIRVVVPALCAAHLVAHEEHGRPEGEETGGKEVLHLAVAQLLDGTIVGRTSTPQFQLRLSSEPSRFSSPLASLCLRS